MNRRHRGFSVLLAMLAVAMLGITTLMLSKAFILDAQRTRRLQSDAQLQQLLLAGAKVAGQRLHVRVPIGDPVALPTDLAGHGGGLTLRETEPGVVVIVARYDDRRAGQRMTFNWTDDRWEPLDAALLPADQLPPE